ncbi:ABC transporter ATP-binding protein [Salininema proteolyticum]|uniref:ABC transporter ATP-binding protein n=1 Tax=Salininema proteolyticum TaxID=1607685 RepID=A0ABV8U5T8_9ACTN
MRIRARGFSYRHAGRRAHALREVDLAVEPGENVLLLGPSGSGKSTLLAVLAGLEHARGGEAAGEMTVDGRDPFETRHRTGMVFQDPETQLIMARCGDDTAFGLENQGVAPERIWPAVARAHEAVGFPYAADHATTALSGGEQQRLALAGILVRRPELLLLDEPTANLDPEGAALVRDAVRPALDDPDITCVMIEHRLDGLWESFDRVVALDSGGRPLADGPVADVLTTHGEILLDQGIRIPGAPATTPRRGEPGEELLRADDVSYRYGKREPLALREASFAVHRGELAALTGHNGSGKSTLSRLLGGLAPPTSGTVTAAGEKKPLHKLKAPALAARVGTVFQNPETQFVTSRVADELAFGPRSAGWSDERTAARVAELLERLRLTHLADANPFTLSGGEARRLSVAGALAAAPDVLLLDEPTFGQDRRTWTEMTDLMDEVRRDGTGLVAVTHDREFIDALADSETVLEGGRVRERRP